MALTYRFTESGKRKQRDDELEGWKAIVATVQGTPLQAEVDGIGLPVGILPITGFDKNHVNYPRWRDAHKLATERARKERQRQTAALAAGPMALGAPVLPCQVNPAIVVRDTLRIAILNTETSEDQGTTIGTSRAQSTAKCMAHLEAIFKAMNTELGSRARHTEAHDLAIHGHPPVQVFLGPEWYFRPRGRPHSQAERDAIVDELQALSRKYPDWLIIPGSIYWTADNPGAPPVNVYNQAIVLFAGSVVKTRTKCNSHDIDPHVAYKERWGMDRVAGAHPASIDAASQQIGMFAHKGKEWCLDVCRDHTVGEAVNGYLHALYAPSNLGAHVYLVTANGTTILEHFHAARNNAVFIRCDGRGAGAHAVEIVTRPNALNTLNVQFDAYWNLFAAQRPFYALVSTADDDNSARRQDPLWPSLKARYDALFAGAPSALSARCLAREQTEKLAAIARGDIAATGLLPAGTSTAERMDEIIATNALPTGTPLTPAELALLVGYAASARIEGTNTLEVTRRSGAINVAKQTYETASAATTAPAGAAAIAIQGFPRLHLFQLVDMP